MGDSLVSPGIGDGCSSDGYANPCLARSGKCSRMLDDVDTLPEDPFGMDTTSMYTGVTGWLKNVELDYGEYESCAVQMSIQLSFPKVDAFLREVGSSSKSIESLMETTSMNKVRDGCNEGFGLLDAFGGCSDKNKVTSGYSSFLEIDSLEVVSYSKVIDSLFHHVGESSKGFGQGSDEDEGSPHAALFLALGYLGVQDLLLIKRVCKSLCFTVQSDPLLWRRICIDKPMSERITDDILLQLTSRAQGNLQCLSLVECQGFTDEGLKLVLESNPKLTQLSVPGCTRLSIEGVITSLRTFKSSTKLGIKQLRIGGLYAVKSEHFEELKNLLSLDREETKINGSNKPHFYSRHAVYLSHEDDRAIDIELCPRCQNPRLVYDCPTKVCQSKGVASSPHCRACFFCVMRCSRCGICLEDSEYEETFCLDPLCAGCSDKPILRYRGKQYGFAGSSKSASDLSCG